MVWCPTGLQYRKWCPARFQNCTWPVAIGPMNHNDGTHGTPRFDQCNPGKGGVHWFGLCGWCSLLAEMLEVLVLALSVMQEKASTFGLQINWSKTKILQVLSSTSSSTVQVADGHVEVVDAFVYLGCMIDSSGGSRGKVLRRIGIARSCMNMLERRIWKSSIRLETKIRLSDINCASFDVWVRDMATTKYLLSRLDAFDTWAARSWEYCTRHVKCGSQRNYWLTGCSPFSHHGD